MSIFRCRKCENYQKSKYAHDWRPITNEITKILDKHCHELHKQKFEV